jgi:Tfp pilus assembly protein PilO
MSMNSNRLWAIVSALLIAVLLAGTFLLVIAPQLEAINKASLEREGVVAQNAVEQAKLDALAEEDKNKDALKEEVEGLRAAIPEQPDLHPLIEQIGAIADTSGVFVESIVFDDPVTYLPPTDLDPSFAGAAGSVSSGNLSVIPIVISVHSPDYNQVMNFIDRLQHSTRFLLVYEFNVVAESTGDGGVMVKLSVTGEAFVLGDAPLAPAAPTVTPGADGTVPQ